MGQVEKIIYFLWEQIKKEPRTIHGLLTGILLILIICFSLNLAYKNPYCFYVAVVLVLIWAVFWFIQSGRVMLPSNKYTLIFCIKSDEKAKPYYDKVFGKLVDRFSLFNLTRNVKIVNVAPDIINNREQAEKYRENYGVDLIIWGNAYLETKDGKPVVSCRLNYTYRLNQRLRNKMLLFNADLLLITGTREWILDTDNTLDEEIKVAENFVEAGTFIFGIHLFTDNNLRDSLAVFNTLHQMLMSMKPDNFKPYIEGRINFIINELYVLLGEEAIEKKDYLFAKDCFVELSKFPVNLFRVYLNLARLEYLLGGLARAKEFTAKAEAIDKKHPAIYLNRAFFSVLDKKYDKALSLYKKVVNLGDVDINISQLLEFFHDRCIENPCELGLIFALGLMGYKFYDRSKGVGDLSVFVNKAKKRKEYSEMVRYAIEVINAEKYRRKQLRKQRKKC